MTAPRPQSVIDWLLDADPAIRWQVMRDLLDAPADEVAAERARVAREGWGARLLAAQKADGHWEGGAYFPNWTSATPNLSLLRSFGVDPGEEHVRRAVELVGANVRWEYDELPYFGGEVEPCINGQAVAIGAYFRQDVRPIVDRLLNDQMADGGWNCEQERGSTVGSFDSTINVLEGFLEYERFVGGDATVRTARERGQEYLLERRLFRRRSTGEVVQPNTGVWLRFAFPHGFHYDVLRGLDHLRETGVAPDERVSDALDVVQERRQADGRWLLDVAYHDELLVDLDETEDGPSRWVTLRALRVLRWAGRRRPAPPAGRSA
jgi:hypothetical protein